MYRYVLDGKSALAWELPFPVTCLPHKDGAVPLSALPKDITSELAGLPSAKQGSYSYHFLKSFGMTRQGE